MSLQPGQPNRINRFPTRKDPVFCRWHHATDEWLFKAVITSVNAPASSLRFGVRTGCMTRPNKSHSLGIMADPAVQAKIESQWLRSRCHHAGLGGITGPAGATYHDPAVSMGLSLRPVVRYFFCLPGSKSGTPASMVDLCDTAFRISGRLHLSQNGKSYAPPFWYLRLPLCVRYSPIPPSKAQGARRTLCAYLRFGIARRTKEQGAPLPVYPQNRIIGLHGLAPNFVVRQWHVHRL